MGVSTTIDLDPARRAHTDMQRLAARVSGEELRELIGAAATEEFKANFTKLDAERANALGGTRTHFYALAGDSTHFDVVPEGALISVVQEGIRQRVLGGDIHMDKKKLAIPAIAEAYGRGPTEFDHLVPLFRKTSGGKSEVFGLGEDVDEVEDRPRKFRKTGETVLDRGSGEHRVFYWLVKSVHQEPDPTVVPTEQALRARIGTTLDEFFATITGSVSV